MSDTQPRTGSAGAEPAESAVRGEQVPPEAGREAEPPVEPVDRNGGVLFAACVMILLGIFQAIAGFVALFNRGYYVVTSNNLLITVDYTGWGWAHLAIGVLVLVAGFGVLAGQSWARIVGIVFAGLSAIVNLGFLAASPFGSVVLIGLDVLVIYALTAYWRQPQRA